MTGAWTSVSVHPRVDTSMGVRVVEASEQSEGFVSLVIGDSGHGVTILVTDEETINALAVLVGQARAKLVGVITRAKRAHAEQAEQPELPELADAL